MKTYNIELTERQLECLIGHIEVDEEIFEEAKEDTPTDYCNTMLIILNNLRKIKKEN